MDCKIISCYHLDSTTVVLQWREILNIQNKFSCEDLNGCKKVRTHKTKNGCLISVLTHHLILQIAFLYFPLCTYL